MGLQWENRRGLILHSTGRAETDRRHRRWYVPTLFDPYIGLILDFFSMVHDWNSRLVIHTSHVPVFTSS